MQQLSPDRTPRMVGCRSLSVCAVFVVWMLFAASLRAGDHPSPAPVSADLDVGEEVVLTDSATLRDGQRQISSQGERIFKVEKLSKGLGISPVKYNAVDANLFRSFGFPGADEYGNMFQMYRDFEKEVNAVRSVEETRKLCGGSVQSFDQWLSTNKAAVKAATEPAPATK